MLFEGLNVKVGRVENKFSRVIKSEPGFDTAAEKKPTKMPGITVIFWYKTGKLLGFLSIQAFTLFFPSCYFRGRKMNTSVLMWVERVRERM